MGAVRSLADLNRLNRQVSDARAAALAKSLLNPFVSRHAASEMEDMHRRLAMIADPAERFTAFRKIPTFESVVLESEAKFAVHQRRRLRDPARYKTGQFHAAKRARKAGQRHYEERQYKARQRAIARNPRKKLSAEGIRMATIVARLFFVHRGQTQKSKELWPAFFEELKRLGLQPVKIKNGNAFEYRYRNRLHKIGFGHFRNLISGCRKKTQSS